ncbi:MAG TPA: hypothetical protein V6D25_27615 [Leptolyngbyaceae cyanobacterium]
MADEGVGGDEGVGEDEGVGGDEGVEGDEGVGGDEGEFLPSPYLIASLQKGQRLLPFPFPLSPFPLSLPLLQATQASEFYTYNGFWFEIFDTRTSQAL